MDMKFGKRLMKGRSGPGWRTMALLTVATTGLLACMDASVPPAGAANGKRGVLEVEVKIDAGRERWKNGTEWKDGAFSQSFTVNIPYAAAPGLDNLNPYDPDYDTKALRQAQRAQAQAQATRIGRQGGGQTTSPFNTVIDPSRMTKVDPERASELARRSQACNKDQDCLMKLGMEMMARNATGQDAEVLQKIQEISAECSKTVSVRDRLKFDACMQEKGARHTTKADGIADTGPGFAEPAADRFQRWDMATPCGATVVADYRYQASEKLNDVSGPAEGTHTAVGAAEGAVIPSQMALACANNQIITDVKTGKLYIQSFYMPMIPVHRTIQSKLLGKPLEEDSPGGLPGGTDIPTGKTVLQWITEQLKGAPLEGHAERVFKIKGDMNGVSRVTNTTGRQETVPDANGDPYAWKRQVANFHETEFAVKVTWRFRELRR